ncbi:unnamed protein product [Pleuronectes platessa]|uniref:Uncharacterized protein n=1 Tax=Pleuronectes platessa TaxID=8262 RepID=A0A9N7VC79_PLEPL|nr:unnamed protein product [Pleuronectes platessa]
MSASARDPSGPRPSPPRVLLPSFLSHPQAPIASAHLFICLQSGGTDRAGREGGVDGGMHGSGVVCGRLFRTRLAMRDEEEISSLRRGLRLSSREGKEKMRNWRYFVSSPFSRLFF